MRVVLLSRMNGVNVERGSLVILKYEMKRESKSQEAVYYGHMIGLLANYGILLISGLALIGISVGANYAHSNDVVAQNTASPKTTVVATANVGTGGGSHAASPSPASTQTESAESNVQTQTPTPKVNTTVETAVTTPPPAPAPVVHTTTTSNTTVKHTTVTLPAGVTTRHHREYEGGDDD